MNSDDATDCCVSLNLPCHMWFATAACLTQIDIPFPSE